MEWDRIDLDTELIGGANRHEVAISEGAIQLIAPNVSLLGLVGN